MQSLPSAKLPAGLVAASSIINRENKASPGEKKEEAPVKKNDIREIRSIKQLAKVNLDLDSPRMKQAIQNLGVAESELMKK
jgi:hypothetical protein